MEEVTNRGARDVGVAPLRDADRVGREPIVRRPLQRVAVPVAKEARGEEEAWGPCAPLAVWRLRGASPYSLTAIFRSKSC